ncbi:hypothetical protein AAHA92_20615 [Salvia divinorum]|uniref:Uncharacterized protein n=1 Tax=Salvia divinorum TaxID=28513 RepID=A0ABD1GHR5_SALDI
MGYLGQAVGHESIFDAGVDGVLSEQWLVLNQPSVEASSSLMLGYLYSVSSVPFCYMDIVFDLTLRDKIQSYIINLIPLNAEIEVGYLCLVVGQDLEPIFDTGFDLFHLELEMKMKGVATTADHLRYD